ncbi:hypothetical protein BDN70DRAFT_423390 [Pholiota conissans]|uniref:Uncharacterized protein n=1 Tax=Pholiota conissans TaxID=109636 RepID=A0A9P6CN16_9AGAR|nr:hypothetical protein BDN70DRAFT_423390 [Pholiota conissans]
MKIEWASHFNPDGTRRRPPPSTMHGWLAKMRGTLIGNEELRSRGMREMREAAARRKRHAEAKRLHAATGKSIFSVFGFRGSSTTHQVPHAKPRVLQQQRAPPSRRTTHDSTRSGHLSRPPPRPSGTSNRTSHRRRTQDSYTSQSGQRRSSRR